MLILKETIAKFDFLAVIMTNECLWEFRCPENLSSLFPLRRPRWAQNCELVHSKSERNEKGEKRRPFMHLWLEKMKVHLYSLKDQSAERQVSRDTKLASLVCSSVCDAPFKLDESSLIIRAGPLNAVCFFPITMFLVEPQSSTLPQTESLSSWHSFRVSLGGVNRYDRFQSVFSFSLICDKCVPGCHGFMAASS